MKWSSRIAETPDFDAGLRQAIDRVRADLAGQSPDLVFSFVSAQHATRYDDIPAPLRSAFPGATIVGCSGGGVIGGFREVERQPAIALTAACLPDVAVRGFHFDSETLLELGTDRAAWLEALDLIPEQQPSFVLLPDPYTCEPGLVLDALDSAFPHCVKIGGLASGSQQPLGHGLFLDEQVHRQGMVGVALVGDVQVDTVVAQGCRPVGELHRVTRADENLVYELDGQPAITVLEHLFRDLSASDQDLFRRAPMVGIGMDPDPRSAGRGDFLVRNLLGIDRVRGLIGVGIQLEMGQLLQFHIRDGRTSAEDLDLLLGRYAVEAGDDAPSGALLFSCLGRGAYLYGRADHDTGMFRRHVGEVPIGGFFCNGEIGPVHARTWLHGFTSSFGLFRPRGLAWA